MGQTAPLRVSVASAMPVSDGQNFNADDDGTLRVNGTAVATGGIFQGASLPGPNVYLGHLFDVVSFDITPLLSPGTNSLNITLAEGFNDALSAVAAFVDLPAGAAPLPEPGSPALVLGALLGLVSILRGRWKA